MCIMLEGKQVTIRNWLKFSSVALLLGFLGAVITSFFVRADAYLEYMNPLDFWELTGTFLWFSVLGLLYSVISQMGFFAYLTVHQFERFFRLFLETRTNRDYCDCIVRSCLLTLHKSR